MTTSNLVTCITAALIAICFFQESCQAARRGRQSHQNFQHVSNTDSTNYTIDTKNHNVSDVAITRQLQNRQFYWETSSLGFVNVAATLGNPMRGLLGNARSAQPGKWPEGVPASLHGYKLPLNDLMKDDPDKVGAAKAFDWTKIDEILNVAAQFRAHIVLSVYIHWPGDPLYLPEFLEDEVDTTWHRGEKHLIWDDPKLLKAIHQFIQHLAARYDGDTRLFDLHAGLLGVWGEWHASGCKVDDRKCLPPSVMDSVTDWYTQYFKQTHISFRYPENKRAFNYGHGFNDGSFTYYTVSGPANGGDMHDFYFYNMSVIHGTDTAYKNGVIGGEVRPENSHIFSEHYPRGTKNHQDFQLCSDIAHVTYMEWGYGFMMDNDVEGIELANARSAHARMGYNFILQKLSVSRGGGNSGTVDVDATIIQIGRAPFYYALFLEAFCTTRESTNRMFIEPSKVASVFIPNSDLVDYGDQKTVTLRNIPQTNVCLNSIQFKLGSPRMYADRPILWAQGSGNVVVNIPLPPGVPNTPVTRVARRRRAIPFVPEENLTDDTIGKCYVVCAQAFCGDRRVPMGDIIRGVSNDDRWQLSETGNVISIRCSMLTSKINRVDFNWPGWDHRETSAPWILGGHIGRTVFPVDYFKRTGRFTFSIEAYENGDRVGDETIDFNIDE